jgi:hypothetical protein
VGWKTWSAFALILVAGAAVFALLPRWVSERPAPEAPPRAEAPPRPEPIPTDSEEEEPLPPIEPETEDEETPAPETEADPLADVERDAPLEKSSNPDLPPPMDSPPP